MTITLQIIGFHNCDGCSRKVEKALRRIGVQLVEFDRETGTVTITTVEPSEVIRRDLERQLKKRQLKKSVVVLSQDLVPAHQNRNPVTPVVPTNGPLDIQELGQAAVRQLTLAPVLNGITNLNTRPTNGVLDLQELGQAAVLALILNSVEITNSNTTRINFLHRENYPPVVSPAYDGYIGGLQIRNADYEPPRRLPRSPPWAVTEPSAPLLPTEEQVVYGYPPDYYGIPTTRNHDDRNGCCNIT